MRNNLLERAVFREEVGSARYDDQFLGPAELSICLFVEFDNAMIFAADNEKRRRPHRQQDAIGKIRPAPPRETTAPISSRRAAATSAAAAPVLAPKSPIGRPRTAGLRCDHRTA